MRLAQISRKLKVKSSEVVAFIEQQFETQIENAPNVKIPDAFVGTIIDQFTKKESTSIPESGQMKAKSELTETEQKEEIETTATPSNIVKKEEGIHETKAESENLGEEKSTEEPEILNIEDGVIKAPKVEVQGIKVVGKIELPKTKEDAVEELSNEKQIEKDTETTATEPTEEAEKKSKLSPVQKKKKSKHKKKSERKPTSHQEQQALAQKRHEERVREEKLLEKEKKKAHYEKMMQERQQKSSKKSKTSPSKLKEISKKNKSAQPKPTKKEPKTLWGKFMRWLNT